MMVVKLLNRLKARSRINRSIGVWYDHDYVANCLARTARVLDITLNRADIIIGNLVHERLIKIGDLRRPGSVSFEDLCLVHSSAYLQRSTEASFLAEIFGLTLETIKVDELLVAQRRAVAGTVEAALAVARNKVDVGFNLGGGFHHAEPTKGSGFCVYNDVAVAISKLRGMGDVAPILIIDLDYHEGNGNVSTFVSDPSVSIYSIHGSEWTQERSDYYCSNLLPPGTRDEQYLSCLKNTLPKFIEKHKPDLVFFIAGNDVLAGDRLGDFSLTPKGVLARDFFVYDTVRSFGAKLVVTLGGGYSDHAWQCSANFLRLLLTDQDKARRAVEPELREKFNVIARKIRVKGLFREKVSTDQTEIDFSEDDLSASLTRIAPSKQILGYYSEHAVELAFEEFGIFPALRERGFRNLRLMIDPSDPDHQLLRVYGKKESEDRQNNEDELLVELLVHRLTIEAPQSPHFLEDRLIRLLAVFCRNLSVSVVTRRLFLN